MWGVRMMDQVPDDCLEAWKLYTVGTAPVDQKVLSVRNVDIDGNTAKHHEDEN